jgi:hypothetical protein
MGAVGSGRWGMHVKADTVEDCVVLDVGRLARDKVFVPGYAGTVHWNNTLTGAELCALSFRVGPRHAEGLLLTLEYRVCRTGENISLPIRLQNTRPHLGGVRWWFTCPLVVNDRSCCRRVRMLYLPPGGKYYGCRHCHALTYRSAQEHDARVSALLRDPEALDRLCAEFLAGPHTAKSLSKGMLAIKADGVLLRRRQRLLR